MESEMLALNQDKIDIDDGITEYMDRIRVLLDTDYQQYSNLDAPIVTYQMGRKYCRIVLCKAHDVKQRRVHSFVDLTNGDILYAASWKAPAKHARGSVLNLNDSNFNVYGAGSLR